MDGVYGVRKQMDITSVLNIPKHTNCKNCGECCGIIPATAIEVNTIRKYITENNIKPVKRADKTICPFRDDKAKKCLIYEVRPIICRLFGVAKGAMQCPNGNSAEIDGEKFLPKDRSNISILNFERW